MDRNKGMKLDKITLGTCYYPEHWEESLWAEDLRRMLEAGIEVIRIAEFAWNKFEPREGEYNFTFFDRFLEVVEETRMKVIFCTPTATPPAWLTHKYPEVLNSTVEGQLYRHGARRHYNYNSLVYQEFTKKIVEQIASHYASHPSIIGWQIDNEINCELDEFYSKSDDQAFLLFLKKKYQTIEHLNQAWGTTFWNQTYNEWDEVHIPQVVVHNSNNPHQIMDYKRFISDSACRYVKLQSDTLRPYLKEGDYITTNGMFSNLDNHRMTDESLNFYMYDSYPNFAFSLESDPKKSKDLNDRKWSKHLSEVRSISPNFGIMEQQSGANGWNTRMEAPAPKPGQLTLWTMQSVAHGADFISYFRWRTCTMGTEIYWHGILDYSNRDNRRLDEVTEVSKKMKRMEEVAGSIYRPTFGVLRDYDNIWDSELDEWHKRIEKVSSQGIFSASQISHTPMDYVYLLAETTVEDLKKYEVLFYPHGTILTSRVAELLEEFVKQGGTLVLGCRTGYKDTTGQCVMMKLPGLLRDLCKADVVDYTFVGPADETSYVQWGDQKLKADVFNDILEPLEGGEVLGTYVNNYYQGQGGLIKAEIGKGSVYYFGSTFTKESTTIFLEKLKIAEPYRDIIKLPKECEIAVREKNGVEYFFVLNYASYKVNIDLKEEMEDLYHGDIVKDNIVLAPYETKVYKKKSSPSVCFI
ncbi:MAG TPA: beta-galactosidase [Candidatus Merdenecus merdavium]|nr:beta-galactosidase [Candidatus Merdenecus merdavium]